MRILHVLQSLEIGGAENVALQLASYQRGQHHEVAVLSLSGPGGALAQRFLDARIALHHVERLRSGLDVGLFCRVIAKCRQLGPQITHAHDPQSLVYGVPAARLLGSKTVYTKHGVDIDSPRRLLLVRQCARLLNAFVAVSQETATVARNQREVEDRRLRVIENGVDATRFDNSARETLRRELGIPTTAFVFGTVGRMETVKNHRLLLRALDELNSDCHLLFVGDGSQRQELQGLATQLRCGERVHFVGARSDVPRLLSALDCFVLSSDSEGLPLALLEAMAAGLPVVSTQVGGIADAVSDGHSAVLVPRRDRSALRQALDEMRMDAKRAREMGANGRQIVLRRFSLRATAEQYLALYRSL